MQKEILNLSVAIYIKEIKIFMHDRDWREVVPYLAPILFGFQFCEVVEYLLTKWFNIQILTITDFLYSLPHLISILWI